MRPSVQGYRTHRTEDCSEALYPRSSTTSGVPRASGDPPEVRIRQIGEGEWRRYRDLRLKALEVDPLAFGSTLGRERRFTAARWKSLLYRRSDPLGSATWAAVSSDGRFVGTVVVAEVEGTLHLFAMWVDPGYRRKGIGGRLVDAALAWVRSTRPGRTVILEVNPRQVSAIRLYESKGFLSSGRSAPLGHTAGERVVEMTLPPSDGSTSRKGPSRPRAPARTKARPSR